MATPVSSQEVSIPSTRMTVFCRATISFYSFF